jgi:nitrate/nitrite-specific signal transduction histidine kinase
MREVAALLTMATKFIQSSHQKGMSTMARARKRNATTAIIKERRTIAGVIHDSLISGLTPHKVLVIFVAAV